MYLHKNWKTQHNTHTLYNKAKSEEKLNQREIEMRNGVVERERVILREKCYINLNRNIDNNCTAVLPFVWRTKCMEIANGCSIYRENDGGCVFCGKVKHL